jgi:hypothetical protein
MHLEHFFFPSLIRPVVAVVTLFGAVLAYRGLAAEVEFGATLRPKVRRGLGWGLIAYLGATAIPLAVVVVVDYVITPVDYDTHFLFEVTSLAAGAATAVLIPARGMSRTAEPAGQGRPGEGRAGGLARWYWGIAAVLVVAVTATACTGSAIAAFARRATHTPGSRWPSFSNGRGGSSFPLPTGWDCWAVAVGVAVLAAVAVFAVARSRWAWTHQQTFRSYAVLATGSTAMVLVGGLALEAADKVQKVTAFKVNPNGADGGEVMPYADLYPQADFLSGFAAPTYFGTALMLLAIVVGATHGKDPGPARSAGPRPHPPDAGSRPE